MLVTYFNSVLWLAIFTCIEGFGWNTSQFFTNDCDWRSEYTFSVNSLCKSFIIRRNYSQIHYGRNFYVFGNSVARHYSFNIKYLLDEYLGIMDTKLSREEEKLVCGKLLDINSCIHVAKSKAMIKFMWMSLLSDKIDKADPRDICAKEHSNFTERCLAKQFNGSTQMDVLILATPIVNSSFHPGPMKELNLFFPRILRSQKSFVGGPQSAHVLLDMLSRVFPGAIVWLPFPYYKGSDNKVEVANKFTRAVVNSYEKSERFIFLNTFPLLKQNVHLYGDSIHHPGNLSDMVVNIIFSVLEPVPNILSSQ